MRIVLVFLLAIAAIKARVIHHASGNQCSISVSYPKGDLKEPQPLILTDTEEPTFVLPNEKQLLIIPKNSSILLACPGRNNALENHGSKQLVKATCLTGKQFFVGSNVHEFHTLKCKVLPIETVKESGTCLEIHQKYDLGYSVGRYFVRLIELCQDRATFRTYYSKSFITKDILGSQRSYPRPYWRGGWLYPGYSINTIYKVKSQLRSMEILLGSEELANEYIRPGDQQYLTRGHLTAKADFVYGSQQTSTFWFLNAAPQWSTFNSGNWMIAESCVRDFATSRLMSLVVYTGVHGVSTLEDVNGIEQSLYLHVNETHTAIPVPRFYWKVIHDPISNRATAIVGLNEPFRKSITKDMYLCEDIGSDPAFSWLTWDPNNIKRGVSYVCSVEDLRKAVPTVPALGEIGLLI